ncbi:hypothetical protein [Crossiella sp. CA198]
MTSGPVTLGRGSPGPEPDPARPRILETVTRIGYRPRVSPDRGAD